MLDFNKNIYTNLLFQILIFTFCCFSEIPLPQLPIIPNYNRIPIGQIEASEAGAYVARASGITASWYNPAGLGLTQSFALNASYTGIEIMKFKLQDFPNSLRSVAFDVTPGFLGVVARLPLKSSKSVSLSLSQPALWRPGFDAISQIDNRFLRLAVFNDVYFTTYYPAISAGLLNSNNLRIGLGIIFPYTSFDVKQSISGHQNSAEPFNYLLSFQTNATAVHLGVSAGVQYRLTDDIQIGAMLRSPGIRLYRNAWIYYDLLKINNDSSISISVIDSNAIFEYKQPAMFSAGVALIKRNWSIELDLNIYQGFGKYTLLRSNEEAIIGRLNSDEEMTNSAQSFPEYFYDNKLVINAAFGGDYRITKHLSLQSGFCTDFSPVQQDNSNAFRSINLYNITFGISTGFKNFTGAIGTRFNFGSSDSYLIGEALLPEPVKTRLIFRSFSFIWAITLGS
ncbi:MAG TPA: hypothetical protein VHP36_05685 [Chitinispirillaceae bacterium]|nr:hypothetical protein [Chitinispirillaceae bacterium]